MAIWLMKTEPSTFSVDSFLTLKDHTTHWEGIRNYQARNFMLKDMRVGDIALIYHSNCDDKGIVGIGEVVREAYPDHFQFDIDSKYYDAKAKPESPIWYMCDIKLVKKLPKTITLAEIKANPRLETMLVIKKGMRLSIQPVTELEWTVLQQDYKI